MAIDLISVGYFSMKPFPPFDSTLIHVVAFQRINNGLNFYSKRFKSLRVYLLLSSFGNQ